MVDAFSEIGFGQGDEELSLGGSKLELKKGDVIRISFLRWKIIEKDGRKVYDLDSGTPTFIRAKVHYVKGVGAVINQGPEWSKLIGGEEPAEKLGTVIISWPIDKTNNIDKDMIKLQRYDIIPWIFAPAKYSILMRKNGIKPFGRHDLMVTCSDTKYQDFDYDACDDSLLRIIMEKEKAIFEDIMWKASIVDGKLKQMIGRVVPLNELREKMSSARGGGGSAQAGASDVVTTGASKLFDDSIG